MRSNNSGDQDIFLAAGIFLIVFFGIPALYAAKASIVNGFLLSVCKVQLQFFAVFSAEANEALALISAQDPGNMTWDQMAKVLSYTGKWVRWPFAGLLICLGCLGILLGRTGGLTRKFTMKTLLENHAEMFPCLTPVVGRGDYLLSRESYDSGPWMLARSPLQFAAAHNLLTNGLGQPWSEADLLRDGLGYTDLPAYGKSVFDSQAATTVFTAQLGDHLRDFSEMPPERRTMAAALLAYAAGAKEAAISVLDRASESYTEEKAPQCKVFEDQAFLKTLDSLFERHAGVATVLNHAFELTWFMGLLSLARKKGVLACSQFLWLRPIDRPLWYALNQCGGRVAWSEAAAAWSHYQAEASEDRSLPGPYVADAVTALFDDLQAQGWLIKKDAPVPADVVDDESSPTSTSTLRTGAMNMEETEDFMELKSSFDPPDETDEQYQSRISRERM